MRAPVDGDDASVVDHLVEKHHVSRRLEKLNILVVGTRNHGRSRIEPQDTSLAHASVLRAESGATKGLRTGGEFLLPIRREGRKLPVRRICDQRASLAPYGRSIVDPERVIGAGLAFSRPAITIDETLSCFRFHCNHFLVGKNVFTAQRIGSFQGGNGAEIPYSLQVRMTVRCHGRRPRLRLLRRSRPSLALDGYWRQQCCSDHGRQSTL